MVKEKILLKGQPVWDRQKSGITRLILIMCLEFVAEQNTGRRSWDGGVACHVQ